MKLSFIIAFFILVCSSCVTIVEEGLEAKDTEVVLNGILQADTSAWVHLSFTSSFSSADFKNIENANVSLYEDGIYLEELVHQFDGFYSGSRSLKTDVTYECIAEIPKYGTVRAADVIPKKVAFQNEFMDNGVPNTEGNSQPRLNIEILHDPSIDSYFDLSIFQKFTGNPFFRAQIVPPYDESIVLEGFGFPLFSNKSMLETPYSFQTHTIVYSFGCNDRGCYTVVPRTIVELRTVSYHLYRYLQQAYLQEQAGIPEFGIGMPPPITSYSNVENGRGIFAAYAYMRSDTIPPPPRPF